MTIASGEELPPSYADAARAGSSSAPPTVSKQQGAAQNKDQGPLGSGAGPSSEVDPPAFAEHTPHVYVGGRRTDTRGTRPDAIANHGFSFSPAESNILTHDPHLNEDGEALYRFLLKTALVPPRVRVSIRGWHEECRESRLGHISHHHHHHRTRGRSHPRTDTVTVIDFDFSIDLTPLLTPALSEDVAQLPDPRENPIRHPVHHNPTVYVKRDEDVAYRGRWHEEVLVRPSDYRHAPRLQRPANVPSVPLASRVAPNEDAQGLLDNDEMAETAPGYADIEAGAGIQNLVLLRPSWAERRALAKAAAARWLPWTKGVHQSTLSEDGISFIERSQYDAGVRTERVGLDTWTGAETTSRPMVNVKVRPAEGLSQTTVRMVCDDYTLSAKELKEFIVKKEVVGWNKKAFENAIRNIVEEVFPTSRQDDRHIEVKLVVDKDTIKVVPDSDLARTLSVFQRTRGARRVIYIILMIITGAFIIILPAVWLLRYFKGARFNTVGIVWQLSQWEVVPTLATDVHDSLAYMVAKEREDAARAGARWAVDDETRCPSEVLEDAINATSPAPTSPFNTRSCVGRDGVVKQQPFVLARVGDQVLAHRGIRQGDVVSAWASRIRSSITAGLRESKQGELGSTLYEHQIPRQTTSFDALTGHPIVGQAW